MGQELKFWARKKPKQNEFRSQNFEINQISEMVKIMGWKFELKENKCWDKSQDFEMNSQSMVQKLKFKDRKIGLRVKKLS